MGVVCCCRGLSDVVSSMLVLLLTVSCIFCRGSGGVGVVGKLNSSLELGT